MWEFVGKDKKGYRGMRAMVHGAFDQRRRRRREHCQFQVFDFFYFFFPS